MCVCSSLCGGKKFVLRACSSSRFKSRGLVRSPGSQGWGQVAEGRQAEVGGQEGAAAVAVRVTVRWHGTQGGEGGLDSGKMRACFPGGRSCSRWLEQLLVGQLTGTNSWARSRASQLPLKGERQGQSEGTCRARSLCKARSHRARHCIGKQVWCPSSSVWALSRLL